MRQIRYLHQIGENIVSVVAQQRVAVKEQGRHTGDEDHVKGHGPDRSRLDAGPEQEGQGGNKNFGDHPGRPHQHPLPLVAKGRCGRSVHVRNRVEHQQHDAHLVHFPAAHLDGKGMAELVKCFQEGKGQPEDHQVAGRQDTVGDVFGQLRPVQTGQKNTVPDHNQPDERADPAEHRPHQRHKEGQNPLGVEQ